MPFWTDLTEPWKSIVGRPVLITGLDYGHQTFLVWIMAIKDSDGGSRSLTLHWLSTDSNALGMMYFGSNILSRIWHWRCHFAQVNATLAMGDTRMGHMLLYMLGVWALIDPREGSTDKKEVLVHGPSHVSKKITAGWTRQMPFALGWLRKRRAVGMPCWSEQGVNFCLDCNREM